MGVKDLVMVLPAELRQPAICTCPPDMVEAVGNVGGAEVFMSGEDMLTKLTVLAGLNMYMTLLTVPAPEFMPVTEVPANAAVRIL